MKKRLLFCIFALVALCLPASAGAPCGNANAATAPDVSCAVGTASEQSRSGKIFPRTKAQSAQTSRKQKAMRVFGRIRFVSVGEDFKVRMVGSPLADLTVRITDFPSAPGEWKIVSMGEDFCVRIVDVGEDFSVYIQR